jgi:hypothetical protein
VGWGAQIVPPPKPSGGLALDLVGRPADVFESKGFEVRFDVWLGEGLADIGIDLVTHGSRQAARRHEHPERVHLELLMQPRLVGDEAERPKFMAMLKRIVEANNAWSRAAKDEGA